MSDALGPEIARAPRGPAAMAARRPRAQKSRGDRAQPSRPRAGDARGSDGSGECAESAELAASATALLHASEELHASLDTQEILRRHCALSRKLLAARTAHTFYLDPKSDRFVEMARAGVAESRPRLSLGRDEIAPLLARLTEQRVVDSLEDLPGASCLAGFATTVGLDAILTVGIRCGGELRGVHVACYRGSASRAGKAAREIAVQLASMASQALGNAHRHEEIVAHSRTHSEFLSILSHELRASLHVILGYGSLLLEGDLGELSSEQNDALRRIGRNARQLADLIDNILCLSRDEAGRLVLWEREVQPSELISDIRKETNALFADRPLSFSWDVPSGLPALHVDPTKLKVVLRNLIGNAVKFTDRGEVRIAVAARGEGVEFSVVDTGSGIAPEMQEAIFEQFRQGGSSDGHGRGGVGLGLYIVRRMLDRLAGRISVTSELGRGSEFRVWVPCRRETRSLIPGEAAPRSLPSYLPKESRASR